MIDVVITDIRLENGNVVFRNISGEIIKITTSQNTFANPHACKDEYIIFNTVASNRETYIENLPVNVNDVTTPTPPLGGWTRDGLLAYCNNNIINKAVNTLGTEATLLNILTALNNMGGGGDKYYEVSISSAISVTILGTQHDFQRYPNVQIFDFNGNSIFGRIDRSNINFDFTITFRTLTTGVIILT